MSSKESLIKKLYEEAVGKEVDKPGTRHMVSTNTLYDHELERQEIKLESSKLIEISVEVQEYNELISGRKHIKVIKSKHNGFIQEIRLVETQGFKPTGNTKIMKVKEYIKGSDSNGIKNGYIVIYIYDDVW